MSAPQPIRLSDYAPPDWLVDEIELHFDLDAHMTRVRARQTLRRAPRAGQDAPLRLDGIGLELVSITLDGAPLAADEYEISETGLALRPRADVAELCVETLIHPASNSEQMGLFVSGGVLATHCEPEGFRRITYFPDRPDVLTRYTVRLEADKTRFPVLLAGGNLVAAGDLPDGRHFATWADPAPKPSYIFAIVAGNLAKLEDRFTTASGRSVELGFYASAERRDQCAFAMQALKRAMAWDEAIYGFECDTDSYNVVALDNFTQAMENKGLNIFDASLIVASPEVTTDEQYDLIERIVGHEYFHNWTGNRVTCRDWFQLCLKEGLTRYRDQCFSADMGAPATKRIQAVRMLRTNQFAEDGGPGAHPVQPREYFSIENFYTATVYEKGAELVRMLRALLGAEGFFAGIARYVERCDGTAATIEDFLAAMADASGRDLTQFALWYSQPGTPRLSIDTEHDASRNALILHVRQRLECGGAISNNARPMQIPLALGFLTKAGQAAAPNCPEWRDGVLEITREAQSFRFESAASDLVLSLNRGFSAPMRLDYNRPDKELALLMAHDGDTFSRWDSGQTLAKKSILANAARYRAGQAMAEDALLLSALDAVLANTELDPAFVAEMLTPPHIGLLGDAMAEIDIDALDAALEHHRAAFARSSQDRLMSAVDTLSAQIEGAPASRRRALRRLRNACLEHLLDANAQETSALMLELLRASNAMTDRSAMLYALCNKGGEACDEALAMTLADWRGNSIALKVWFRAQAMSRLPDTAQRVAALTQHPAFDMNDGPLAMSLLGGFFRQNQVGFHVGSGAGYRLLGDTLLLVDKIRPNGARWLMPQIMNWRRFDANRRALMKAQLQRIADTPGISLTLMENIANALEDSAARRARENAA